MTSDPNTSGSNPMYIDKVPFGQNPGVPEYNNYDPENSDITHYDVALGIKNTRKPSLTNEKSLSGFISRAQNSFIQQFSPALIKDLNEAYTGSDNFNHQYENASKKEHTPSEFSNSKEFLAWKETRNEIQEDLDLLLNGKTS